MRRHWNIACGEFRKYSTYQVAALAGLFTNVVFGLLRSAVMTALFTERSVVGGFSQAQSLTYVWLTQGLMTVVQIYGSSEFAQRIQSGDIVTDLQRPIDPQLMYLAADYGRAAYHTLYRGIPPVVIGALISDLVCPTTAAMWVAFTASLVLAVAIGFLFRFLYGLTAFWLLDPRGVALVAVIVTNVFSGFVVPVSFFPGWLHAIAAATPFPGMVQIPIEIFTGAAQGWDAMRQLATQLAWVLGLLTCGRIVYARGRRHLVVQGG
ncbi:ABC transporter permease [Streptomyces sp. NPDC020192]|uniref:ABC transporter permease n=1 Tax=Streptomyces sp. NPDC020192 TaxID=3365066 RepID=UPI003797B50B